MSFAILLLAASIGTPEVPLEAALRARYPDVVRWEVEALDARRAARVGADAVVVRLGSRSALAGTDGRLVWFDVRGFRDVLVATRAIAAHADVAVGDVAVEERDVLAVACEPLETLGAIAEPWTRRVVRAGDVVCADALQPKPAVVQGANVVVEYSAPPVRVIAIARAEQDAEVGERLAVRNPETGEIYYVVVSGKNEVKAHD